MSIMKTITFPGDTEPREIQDNRIEILTVSENGTVSLSPDEIQELMRQDKIVCFNMDGLLYTFNATAALMQGKLIFSAIPTIYNPSDRPDIDVPVVIDSGFIINDDKTVTLVPELNSKSDMFRFCLPKIQEGTEQHVLTTMPMGNAGIPVWSPIPTAKESQLGMVKAITATPEMTEYIGIDGNGQLRVAPSNDIKTDSTLSIAGDAADAQAVGNRLASLPISWSENHQYAEITKMRQATNIHINKDSETQITVTTELENDDPAHIIANTAVITLDPATGYPSQIVTNGEIVCEIQWEGWN